MMRIVLLCLAAFVLSAFTNQPLAGQPKDERDAQNALPQSRDPAWALLATTKVTMDQKKGTYSAVYPPKVHALFGHDLRVAGFILPLEAGEKFSHFLLSRRTPTCQFCPPGEPNEIIDVTLDKPTAWKEDMVTVTGHFEKMSNAELGVFFALKHAKAAF